MDSNKKQTAVDWLMGEISHDNGYGERLNSYIETFDLTEIFKKAKEMEKEQIIDAKIEIGMYKGQSIRLFREWFSNGNIFGIDVGEYVDANTFQIEGTSLFWGDAFDSNMLDLFKDNFFDFIIDDGPHTLESQLYSIVYWSKKLKSGGKLIIEDIQSINHVTYLERIVDINLFTFNSFDLRANKNRYDDIIFEVTKK
jgi:hypothetical protein